MNNTSKDILASQANSLAETTGLEADVVMSARQLRGNPPAYTLMVYEGGGEYEILTLNEDRLIPHIRCPRANLSADVATPDQLIDAMKTMIASYEIASLISSLISRKNAAA